MKKKNTNKFINIVLILVFLVGLSLLLYPTVSDYWNSFHQSRAIASYVDEVAGLDKEEYERIWNVAVEYNQKLAVQGTDFYMTEEEIAEYEQMLDVSGLGVMGYIEIPKIQCSLPIYHGTDEGVLQIAIGHLEWSSLPVGGTSSHCVLSGHRGLLVRGHRIENISEDIQVTSDALQIDPLLVAVFVAVPILLGLLIALLLQGRSKKKDRGDTHEIT